MPTGSDFDDKGVAIRVLFARDAPVALWFAKHGRCFLALKPTDRGAIDIRSHITNITSFSLVPLGGDVLLLEVRPHPAIAGEMAQIVLASQLTFTPERSDACMTLLKVMGDIDGVLPTSGAVFSQADWAGDCSLAARSSQGSMPTGSDFDDKGVAIRVLFARDAPVALWFAKHGRCFLALKPTERGAAWIEESVPVVKPTAHVSLASSNQKGIFAIELHIPANPLQTKFVVDAVSESQLVYESVAAALHHGMLKKHKGSSSFMKMLPLHMVNTSLSLDPDKVLRPVPTFITSIRHEFHSNHTSEKVTFSKAITTFLFRGASGAGKTMAAINLPRTFLTDCKVTTVVGYYFVPSGAERDLDTLATNVATHVVDVIKEHVTYMPTMFGKVTCYVVVDEVGSSFDFVSRVVCDKKATIKKTVVERLQDYSLLQQINKNEILEGVSVVVSLVGTGVGRSSVVGTSLPDNYYFCDVAPVVPGEVFEKALMVAAGLDDPANPAHNELVKKIVHAVNKNPLLDSMKTNSRCAQYAGAELGQLIKIEYLNAPKAPAADEKVDSNVPDTCLSDLVLQNAESIVSRTSSMYIKVNGWAKADVAAKRTDLISALLTIPFTQPYGYHVLPDETLRALTCDVGAVVDTLYWKEGPSASLPPTADPRILKIALGNKFKAYPILPIVDASSKLHPHIGGSKRFIIPSAVIVVMLAWLAKAPIFGNAKTSPSSVYETILPRLTYAKLVTFLNHSESIPLPLVYPELLLTNELDSELAFKGSKEKPPLFLTPVPLSNSPEEKFEAARTKYEASGGLMVEMAGGGVPQNDLMVYNGQAIVGEEYKYYTQGGFVELSVLLKRAYQMGYGFVNISVGRAAESVEVKTNKSDRTFKAYELHDGGMLERMNGNVKIRSVLFGDTVTITIPSRPSGTSGLGKYHALRMRDLAPEAQEYVVLCGPGGSLLPPGVTVTFTQRACMQKGLSRQALKELNYTHVNGVQVASYFVDLSLVDLLFMYLYFVYELISFQKN